MDAATLALDARLGTHLTIDEEQGQVSGASVAQEDREGAVGSSRDAGRAEAAEILPNGDISGGETDKPRARAAASHQDESIKPEAATTGKGSSANSAGTKRRLSRWPLVVFIISALICLGCSVTYHLFYVVSEEWFGFLQRLDYSGIAILIFGSNMPPIQYLYYCRGEERTIFTLMSFVTAAGCLCMGLLEFFRHKKW